MLDQHTCCSCFNNLFLLIEDMCSQGILPLFLWVFIIFHSLSVSASRGLPGSVDPVLKLADFGFARALPEQDMVRISADNKLATKWSSKQSNPITWRKHREPLYMIYNYIYIFIIYNYITCPDACLTSQIFDFLALALRCMYRYIQLTQRITPTYIYIYSYTPTPTIHGYTWMVEVTGACQELWVHELNPGVFGVFPSVILKFDIFDGICADMCPHTELALGCKTLKITYIRCDTMSYPIGSMYGIYIYMIYANIWGILMVIKWYHILVYSIHGSYGYCNWDW